MTQRSVVSWTAMIVAYEQNSLVENFLEIFKKMQLADVELNSATFSSILPACAKMGALDEGMKIHRKVFEDGFSSDVIVVTALIDMYAKCGNLQKAHELFDSIPQQDVVSWIAIVAGYAQNGFVDKALEIFKHMQFLGVKPKFNNFCQRSSTPVLRFRNAQNGDVEKDFKTFKQMQFAEVDEQKKVINRSLGNLLRCLVGGKIRSWNLILAQAEFAYNNSTNRITGRMPFEIVTEAHPRGILELRDINNEDKQSAEVEEFADHMKALHTKVKKHFEDMNIKYKEKADEKRSHKEFEVGNEVMVYL
ncbi:pentatricopeptide repeat-containing protein DOT4, chloroplastic-like [Cryptomeria japonica]|uniref:pentatricopeptide repeat-containing protein DOT4, chloroplastic-like n=1 Tax=Cryptomeria japonica TaxID=3369 RepID=UPI0027DA421D|nr:pentatricopeptide repeat-containing protein DOT4, chloroplastic-like [Cryptomeria japonica]